MKQIARGALELERTLTGGLRLWPDFIIIGVQRGGTTSLFHYLSQHPDVDSSSRKEVHFFDLHYERGTRWYRSHFPLQLARRRAQQQGRNFITGEGTPYYIYHPHAARRIRQVTPHAKLIVLLRHPVDRAYSHYQKMVRGKVEDLSFEAAIEREAERIQDEERRLREDESYQSLAHQHYSYLARGHYAEQLQRWLELFPGEQLLILKSEDLYSDPATVVQKTMEFLNLRPWELKEYKKYNQARYSGLDPATRERLVEYFAPHNRKLRELLGTDFGWDS
jgi:Sulfotransferase domain